MNFTHRISLKWKLIGLPVGAVVILSAAFCIATFWVISKTFDRQSAQEINSRSGAINHLLELAKQRCLDAAMLQTSNPDIAADLVEGKYDALQALISGAAKTTGLDTVTIYDASGKPAAQSGSEPSKTAASRSSVPLGLSGKSGAGFEHDAYGRFVICSVVPIKKDNIVVGCMLVDQVVKGEEFVDRVKSIFGVECTLFDKDTRAVTTIVRDGKRFTGTKMDNAKVLEAVLHQGQSFLNRNLIGGKDYDTAYWPLHNVQGEVVGMGFIGRDREDVRQSYLKLFGFLAVIISLACSGVATGAFFVARGIGSLLHRLAESLLASSREVTSASRQISTASQSLASSSSEQASSLETASASLAEISSMVQRNAENAEQAHSIGQHTRQDAEHGTSDMNDMNRAMNEIKSSSDDIAKIIKTIDEIAFQTNLLALNAAVEAARAGEAGAGFAVVADEVRSLARRSADAAKETSTQISSAISRAAQGVSISKKVGTNLQQIVESVRKLDSLTAGVTTASKEQSEGLASLNQSVSQMDTTTQSNAAASEETAAAATQLDAQAQVLMEAVTDLFTFIDGSPRAAVEPEQKANIQTYTKPRTIQRPKIRFQPSRA